MSVSEQVDKGLQNLELLLDTLNTSLGKNSKFSSLVKVVNDTEQKIASTRIALLTLANSAFRQTAIS